MILSGIQSFSLLDFPERTSCIAFTPGCNFRCGYCHNPEFVLPEKIQQIRSHVIPEETFFSFLETRRGLLDGVVVSGGEPTIQGDIIPFITKIKSHGFLVKLDTNGNLPSVIKKIFDHGLVDYIAMDVKTSMSGYRNLVGSRVRADHIEKSIQIIMRAGVLYEFRVTLIKEIHTPDVLEDMRQMMRGASRVFLQKFRMDTTLDPVYASYHPFSDGEMISLTHFFRSTVGTAMVR